ncbi:MAG TPA: hypothetical protein VIF14_12285 [Alphaproteobacteria bacterium]|jgi:hypothetical protein
MKRIFLFGLAALALPALANAQNAATSFCKNGALPFAASEGNRLTGPALQQALSGKTLGYVRESTRGGGIWFSLTREFRADGSAVHSCQAGRGPSGPWGACRRIGEEKVNVAGARDIGVWSVKDNGLCVESASFGQRSAGCFAIYRQGQAFAARQLSGNRSFCIEGTITLQ